MVEVEAFANAEEDNGWTVLDEGERGGRRGWRDSSGLSRPKCTVEPGFRWIKHPAAIGPVWLEKPERIAALAMLTVLGLLVYNVIQRQVRLYLLTHDEQLPGNKGLTGHPNSGGGVGLVCTSSTGPIMDR